MSTPKPSKVITKNLQDIINNSKYSTSSLCGISNVNNFQQTQNSRLSSPKSKKHSIQPSIIKLEETPQKYINKKNCSLGLNSSLSKHSLKSKQKINIVSFCKDNSRVERDQENQQENYFGQPNLVVNNIQKTNLTQSNISSNKTKNFIQTHQQINLQPSCTKIIQKKKKQSITSINPITDNLLSQVNQNHIKSLYFNQIDVIFTELQDFLRQVRQGFINQFGYGDDQLSVDSREGEKKKEKIIKLEVLSQAFKQEVRKVVWQEDNYQDRRFECNQNLQSLFTKTNSHSFKNTTKQSSKPSNKPLFQQQKSQQLQNIQQFMQRQNTINSTILSPQDDQQSYLPTQTDTELLSMLVFKNKVNNTKRKYQQHAVGGNGINQNQALMVSSRSGMNSNTSRKNQSKDKKDRQCQYSFRNSKDMKQNVIVLKENPSSIRLNTNTKKQSQYSSRQKDQKYHTMTSDFSKKNYYKQTPVNKKKQPKQKHHFYTQKPERSVQKQNMKPSTYYCSGFSATKSSFNWNGQASKTGLKNSTVSYNNNQRPAGIALVTKKQNKEKSIYELVLEQNRKGNKTQYMKTVA